jgi:hypothetical protein
MLKFGDFQSNFRLCIASCFADFLSQAQQFRLAATAMRSQSTMPQIPKILIAQDSKSLSRPMRPANILLHQATKAEFDVKCAAMQNSRTG